MNSTDKIPNKAVEAVLRGEPTQLDPRKKAELDKEKSRVEAMLAKQLKFDLRVQRVQSAYGKILAAVRHDLTPEERQAVDGMYFVIHGGMVDQLKLLPKEK